MNSLRGIKFLFSSRGLARWAERLVTIQRRFSLTPHKQMGIIRKFEQCLKEEGLKGNFFIPAVLLERYAPYLKTLDRTTIEWGIHGLVHTDHSQLDYDQQKEQLAEAVATFDRCGIEFKGFRCPYLRSNIHTRKILTELGRFQFDSSDSVIFANLYGPQGRYYSWIKEFYRAKEYTHGILRPSLIEKMTGIPVSLPDDDVLVDREKLSGEEIYQIWNSILKTCHDQREVFVLQLHPERFVELEDVLRRLIRAAKALKPAIWITILSEVAAWSKEHPGTVSPPAYQGAFCITGDIDAVTIQDFLRRIKDW